MTISMTHTSTTTRRCERYNCLPATWHQDGATHDEHGDDNNNATALLHLIALLSLYPYRALSLRRQRTTVAASHPRRLLRLSIASESFGRDLVINLGSSRPGLRDAEKVGSRHTIKLQVGKYYVDLSTLLPNGNRIGAGMIRVSPQSYPLVLKGPGI